MLRRSVLLLMVLACTGCSLSPHSEGDDMRVTMVAYANALRWQGFDQAVEYVDPETLKKHPLTPLDMERYKQVRWCYMEQNPVPGETPRHADGRDRPRQHQYVEARQVVDHQLWRYDEKRSAGGC